MTGRRRTLERGDRREVGAIFVGGAIGAAARAELAVALPVAPGTWPWPTFIVNIAGALILAIVVTLMQEQPPVSAYHHPLLATGFCGTVTTFATMQVEVLAMVEGGHLLLAAGYLGATVICGLAAVAVTTRCVRRRSVV